MRDFLTSFFPAQELAEGAREGLPYWIFWLLLSIIVLLMAFIFLRDKDLRRRLDLFFARIKKKLTVIRLHSLLKKEGQKQESFFTEIGQKAWDEKIRIESGDSLFHELAALEEKKSGQEKERNEMNTKIITLKKNLEDFQQTQELQHSDLETQKIPFNKKLASIRDKEKAIELDVMQFQHTREDNIKKLNHANKETLEVDDNSTLSLEEKKSAKADLKELIGSLEEKIKEVDSKVAELVKKKAEQENKALSQQKKIDDINQKIKTLADEKKQETRKFQKEIKEWEKSREKIEEKLKTIEKEKAPLFNNLGKLINEERIEHKELAVFYSKIDRTFKRKQDIQTQISDLEK